MMKATQKTLAQIRAALDAYTGEKTEALQFIDSLSDDGVTYKVFCAAIAQASSKLDIRVSYAKEHWETARAIVNANGLNKSNIVSAIDTHVRDINRDKGAFRATNFSALDILAALEKYVEQKNVSRVSRAPYVKSTVMRAGVEQKVWNDGHIGERTVTQ